MLANYPTDPNKPRYRTRRPLLLAAAACGLLALFALIGLATSAESVEDYQDRQLAGPGDDNNANDPADDPIEDLEPTESTMEDSPGQAAGEPDRTEQLIPDDNKRYFYPDDGEGIAGLRVTDDGHLEPVPAGDLEPGDLLLGDRGDGGVGIVDPQTGTRIELVNDGTGISGRSSVPGGGYTPLAPDDSGSVVALPAEAFNPEQLAGADGSEVVLNPSNGPISVTFTEDGLVAEPLPDDAVVINDLLDRVFAGSQSLPWRWVFLSYAALAVASVLGGLILHRRRPRHHLDVGPFSAAPQEIDRFEQLLASLSADPDPTHAVCAAFAVAERGLGQLAPRRAQETPSEWYHRLLAETQQPRSFGGRVEPRAEMAQRLGPVCDLYARARFAPDRATVTEQHAMVAALRDLHASATSHQRAAAVATQPLAGTAPNSVDR